MAQDIWTGIVAWNGAAQGWQFDGKDLVRQTCGVSGSEVVGALGDRLALIVSDGATVHPVPAKVLPHDLPFGDLSQTQPRGLLGATARLCIAGALMNRADWDGVICLQMHDATHWCQISADEVVSFQSALSPLLAKALQASGVADPEAISDTMSRPERLAVHLRSAQLSHAAEALMGHLLGAELAAMRPYWLGQRVIVIEHNNLYAAALQSQGVPVESIPLNDCMRDGLIALRQSHG